MGGTTLIWWESRTRDDLKKSGKTISSWNDFVIALKQQFYPLAYMQQEMMNWQCLRQSKGQSVQEYTQIFRKKDLNLGIPLYTQETLLKYISGLHSYLKHTILMLNPSITLMKYVYKPFTLNLVKGMLVIVFLQILGKERIHGKEKRKRRGKPQQERRSLLASIARK